MGTHPTRFRVESIQLLDSPFIPRAGGLFVVRLFVVVPSRYINETSMTDEQYYFVNQIVEYVVQNGVMEDMSVLMEAPFTDRGKLSDLFGSDMETWSRIKRAIDAINDNARTAQI